SGLFHHSGTRGAPSRRLHGLPGRDAGRGVPGRGDRPGRPRCLRQRGVWSRPMMATRITALVFAALLLSPPALAVAGLNQWTSNGPPGGSLSALAVDPMTPTTLYAGTLAGGVFRSVNAGSSWQPVNTGLTELFVRTLAIDPATPTTLYAGI